MVGAYLSQLGFSYAAIGYITSAAPTSLKWMTPEDAKRYGFGRTQEPGMTLEKATKNQAILVRAEWSKPVPNWDQLRRAYGERVLFHEKEISADEVIKKRFAER